MITAKLKPTIMDIRYLLRIIECHFHVNIDLSNFVRVVIFYWGLINVKFVLEINSDFP